MKYHFSILFILVGIFILSSKVSASNSSGKTIKLLCIGNSFSEDAVEYYLSDLAKSKQKSIIIGNLYIGGASIQLHLSNALYDAKKYSYRKISLDGKKTVVEHVSISEALHDEDWDYISFQQASPLSGKYLSYISDLPRLLHYVRVNVGVSPKFMLHQTWAYQKDSKHEGFKHYNRDQTIMYDSIMNATQKVYNWGVFADIIPVGTAVQNARLSFLGDSFTSDGYHLNKNYGRFLASCTWYEVLFHDNVMHNDYVPLNISYIESEIIKKAAHHAVMNPFFVTADKDDIILLDVE